MPEPPDPTGMGLRALVFNQEGYPGGPEGLGKTALDRAVDIPRDTRSSARGHLTGQEAPSVEVVPLERRLSLSARESPERGFLQRKWLSSDWSVPIRMGQSPRGEEAVGKVMATRVPSPGAESR